MVGYFLGVYRRGLKGIIVYETTGACASLNTCSESWINQVLMVPNVIKKEVSKREVVGVIRSLGNARSFQHVCKGVACACSFVWW